MLLLIYTVASYYYNCCTDGRTSAGNCGYHLESEETATYTKCLIKRYRKSECEHYGRKKITIFYISMDPEVLS
jgi:hypothetical protein